MPHIPKVACLECHVAMRPTQNAVTIEMLREGDLPYYKIMGDIHTCPKCGNSVVAGFAAMPLAEHWQDGYASVNAHTKVSL